MRELERTLLLIRCVLANFFFSSWRLGEFRLITFVPSPSTQGSLGAAVDRRSVVFLARLCLTFK